MKMILSNDAKEELMSRLREQGYSVYARLLRPFDVYLTEEPKFVGAMEPGKARIILNKHLGWKEASLVVRHEILHEFLDHAMRQGEFETAKGKKGSHHTANVAMDLEISNKGYTDADKSTVRGLQINKVPLRGLVTEDDFPGWENMTFEEMYDKLIDMQEDEKDELQKKVDKLTIGDKSLEDIESELDDMSSDISDDSSDNETPTKQPSSETNSKDSNSDVESGDGTPSSSSDSKSNEQEDSEAKKLAQDKDNLKDKIDDTQQDIKNLENSKEGVFDTDAESKERARIAANVEEIKKLFSDVKNREDAFHATNVVQQKERNLIRSHETERRNADPLQQFKLNLNKFVKDQISEIEDDTYSRIHPSYEDSEFIIPGRHILDNKFIPKINVYHDVSGSFSDPAKTEMAMRAIDSLNKYKRQGDIDLEVFYFADRVSSTKEGAGGGTEGTPIQEHIKLTKPTNVIIITDGDIDDCREVVYVPGAVWMLFYGSESRNVQEHIRGKKQNKYYDVTWRGV